MPKSSLPTLSPATAQTTEQAVAQYEAIVARGGWPVVPAKERLRHCAPCGVACCASASSPPMIFEANAGVTDIFDPYVEGAVRRFQARHGLTVDGVVRDQTLKPLNVPAPVRLAQLKTNLARLRARQSRQPPRRLQYSVAQIEAIQDGVAVTRHTAVAAGKPTAPRRISRAGSSTNFNPFWTVPVSIVRKDLIPKMQAEPDYLGKNRIRISSMPAAASSRRQRSIGIRKRR